MDDDIMVDIFGLQIKLNNQYPNLDNILLGYKQMGLLPQRSKNSKWFVSKEEFKQDIYPDFLSGWAWMTSPFTAKSLVNQAQVSDMFWIDDLWITGMLAHQIGAKIEALNSFYTVYLEHIKCCLNEKTSELYMCDFLVGPSLNREDLIRRFGRLSVDCHIKRPNYCQRRKWKDSVIKNCVNIENPFFLPDSKGVAEVLTIENKI